MLKDGKIFRCVAKVLKNPFTAQGFFQKKEIVGSVLYVKVKKEHFKLWKSCCNHNKILATVVLDQFYEHPWQAVCRSLDFIDQKVSSFFLCN